MTTGEYRSCGTGSHRQQSQKEGICYDEVFTEARQIPDAAGRLSAGSRYPDGHRLLDQSVSYVGRRRPERVRVLPGQSGRRDHRQHGDPVRHRRCARYGRRPRRYIGARRYRFLADDAAFAVARRCVGPDRRGGERGFRQDQQPVYWYHQRFNRRHLLQ